MANPLPSPSRFAIAGSAFLVAVLGVLMAGTLRLRAESIPLVSAEASFHGGDVADLASVIDGVAAGPRGWFVAPRIGDPHAMIFRPARPVEAAELEISLFFLSGRPNNSIAEFALSFTTDPEPSQEGNWQPLEIQRFTTEVANLRRVDGGHLRADPLADVMSGVIPDDTYRIAALLPKGRATGFRLQVFPVTLGENLEPWMSWGTPHDFVLTEFRVEERARATTDIALHCPVTASHPLFADMRPGALTDGLPATIAHPQEESLGADFHFDIDLGRVAILDHLGLRGRGDGYFDRFSRMRIRLYEDDPVTGAAPIWECLHRPDGSYPESSQADIIRAAQGQGVFRARYLRLSSDHPVPLSPQLADVEVYESRTPRLLSARADGRDLVIGNEGLVLPPGVRRISLQLRIPQIGLPTGEAFRWRVRGDLDQWQTSPLMSIDLPCPPPGKTFFQAQAMHSDREWDATMLSVPILTRQYFWENRLFQLLAGIGVLGIAIALARLLTKRRAARKLSEMKSRASIAEERARIARDLHDDLGANLARIGFLTELAERSLAEPDRARDQLGKIYSTARDLTRQLDSVVWAVDPANDTLESLARYLHGLAGEYLELAGIRCDFISTDRMPEVTLDSRFRHHLLMMVKEALHNIVAHASASVVILRLAVEGAKLELEIVDDGRGLPSPDSMKSGNGLQNLATRARALGGSCEFPAPKSGLGTRILLTLPLPHPICNS
ncbi:MAG: sensor histidine kinase [Verrucomicrobia bacterium]|nr:MAG: sensor histidine kinase [Verrucomicrobiota bacterium]TAE87270.1 MAG: sensor histidine kinase [Verrucomicrobiota bacterium]TAF25105.1 MAG: sensor histidine kinase [Verrucomicrobiota bacterium]